MPGASATKPAFGLTAKIFVGSTLLVLAVLGLTFGVTTMQANRTADASINRALQSTRRAVDDYLAARTRTLGRASTVATDVPQYRQRLLDQRQRAEALDQADDVRGLIGAAWVLVTNSEAILIARTDYREQQGVDLSIAPLVANALSGDQTSGAWLDDVRGAMFMAVGTPLRDRPTAAPLGALVATYQIDDSLAGAIKQATNSDVVFFMLDTLNKPVVAGSTVPAQDIGPALQGAVNTEALAADTGGGTPLAATMNGEHLIGLAGAIRSPSGDVRGGFVALRSREAELALFNTLRRTMLWAVALGVVLALIWAFMQARQIAGPVRRLVLATRQVQDGDFSVDVAVESRDEIGILSKAFKSLVDDLKAKAALVDYMMETSGGAPTQRLDSATTVVRAAGGGREPLRPGAVFAGRYEVKEIIGAGGMGIVYRAFDRELQEPVAIKTLRPESMGSGAGLERFKQEIRLARRIAHRNVVRTYDLGEQNGMYYLTMEYVEGTSLKQLIVSRGKLPVEVTLTVGKQLCRALEVAHAEGVIHRDIKPQNIVVEPNGFLKVMDFGIARLVNPPQGKGLTEAGTSIGTPDYMSPEQLSGLELDSRSDLYAAGVVLFECLTGRLPFEAETTWALIAKHLEEDAPDPRALNPDVPGALGVVILTAMAKDPNKRFASASQMHDALARIG